MRKSAPTSRFVSAYQLLSDVSSRNVRINERIASLLLENCDLSFASKASTSFFGALNSTNCISKTSFFGVIILFLGTFLSPSLPDDDHNELLSEASNKSVVTIFKVVRREPLWEFSRGEFYIFFIYVLYDFQPVSFPDISS